MFRLKYDFLIIKERLWVWVNMFKYFCFWYVFVMCLLVGVEGMFCLCKKKFRFDFRFVCFLFYGWDVD